MNEQQPLLAELTPEEREKFLKARKALQRIGATEGSSQQKVLLFDSEMQATATPFIEDKEVEIKEYQEGGGDAGAIANAIIPPAIGYSAPVHTLIPEVVPKTPVIKPVVTPPAVNALNVAGKLARSTPAMLAVGDPTTALMTGRYEKDKNLPEQGIFGDGYDSRKHGMYLEFPGIDVGRIPYYFNRSMHDMVINPIRSAFTPDPVDPDFEIVGADNGVPMPEPPESTRSEKPVPMPDITELLQSGIY